MIPIDLQDDKQVVLAAVAENGRLLAEASQRLKDDDEVVLAAIAQDGRALKYAAKRWRNDKDLVLLAVSISTNGYALGFAKRNLKGNREFMLAAVATRWTVLRFGLDDLKDDKEFILKSLRIEGSCLQYASTRLRADKDCILAAVATTPSALKFALSGLHQDRDCLIAAGIWEDRPSITAKARVQTTKLAKNRPRIVLSTRFSLHEKSTSIATDFAVLLKQHEYVCVERQFDVYSPNACDKKSCDPNWTDLEWPCRGTFQTCRMKSKLKRGEPTNDSCWRCSFRCKLMEAKQRRGFMIQVVEIFDEKLNFVLGKGQTIELEMAQQVGAKVFQVYQPLNYCCSRKGPQAESFRTEHIDMLVRELKEWYQHDCVDMCVTKVRF